MEILHLLKGAADSEHQPTVADDQEGDIKHRCSAIYIGTGQSYLASASLLSPEQRGGRNCVLPLANNSCAPIGLSDPCH